MGKTLLTGSEFNFCFGGRPRFLGVGAVSCLQSSFFVTVPSFLDLKPFSLPSLSDSNFVSKLPKLKL